MTTAAVSSTPTVVIIGAGSAGLTVAARLRRQRPELAITLVDPASHHYYQPAWTLVGGGEYAAEATRRPLADCLPQGVTHRQVAVTELLPEHNQLRLDDESTLKYDYLIVAAGIQNNWSAIEGLEAALGKNGVSSNYRYDLAPYTWQQVQQLPAGATAVFTQPAGAIKCPGAPQKALYLAADYFQRVKRTVQLQFWSGAPSIFGVPFYAEALKPILAGYGAQAHYQQNLVAVRGEEKVAVFEHTVDGQVQRQDVAYDFLHVVPPQSAPDFIRRSALADAAGWLEVDPNRLQHVRFANVFGLGDCTSTPNSKTAAAIKNQAPVVVAQLLATIDQHESDALYDGYAGCPLTISNKTVLLAEFTYGGVVTPSFSADPRVPRRFYWWLKQRFLPWLYWSRFIKGKDLPSWHKERSFEAAAQPMPKQG